MRVLLNDRKLIDKIKWKLGTGIYIEMTSYYDMDFQYGQMVFKHEISRSGITCPILVSYPDQALLCGMDSVYTQRMSTFHSPMYPQTYPNNFHCEWKIKVETEKVIVCIFILLVEWLFRTLFSSWKIK